MAILCLAAILLECVTDMLPDGPLFWLITPVRLVLAVGLIAVLATGTFNFRTPADIPIAALLVSATVANYAAGQQWAAWRGLVTVIVVYYLVVGVRRAIPDSWSGISIFALVCVTVTSVAAVQQVAEDRPTGFCRGALDGSNDICGPDTMIRAVGTFSNPNLLAAFLVLMLPLAAAGAAAFTDRWTQLLGGGLVVIGYLAVVLSGSRGGMLAAMAGLATFVLLRRLRPGRHATAENPSRWLVPAICAVGLGALFVAFVTRGNIGIREDVWAAAARVVANNPLGVGPGRAGAFVEQAVASDETFQHTHNLWLNYAVETGMVGFLAVLAITVLAIWMAITATQNGSPTAPATAAGMMGFAVISLADHPANNERIAFAVSIVLAVLFVDKLQKVRSASVSVGPWSQDDVDPSMFEETRPIPRIAAAAVVPPPPPPTARPIRIV